MTDGLSMRLLQMNARVGDLVGNVDHIIEAVEQAKSDGIQLLVAPELAITGYPPEDLLLRPALLEQLDHAVGRLAMASQGITLIVGGPEPLGVRAERSPWRLGSATSGPPVLFNSAWILQDGVVKNTYQKQALPNYQVFDERRYFEPGSGPCVETIAGVRVGILVCEDVWVPEIVEATRTAGADVIVVLNASPFAEHKITERLAHVAHRAEANGCAIAYVNLLGGQDELIFDGGSFAINPDGQCAAQAACFESGHLDLHWADGCFQPGIQVPLPSADAALYAALVMGVRDYFAKTGFSRAVLGLSGGIDSALTLAIAVDALGADRVHAVMMPYRYTADISQADAKAQAATLGCEFSVVPIEPMVDAFLGTLQPFFAGHPVDTTEENLQSRCRGVLLMALSNKTGALVLTTGNKSEMAVGYATLYGDMAGGFAVLKDVWKTRVYALARYVNREREIIPDRVITRPPSAELAPGQEDADSLPPYDQLDAMLALYIEEDRSPEEIIAAGFAADDVKRMCRLVDISEYKRRQSAIGTRVTVRGFGRDRRYPVANRFRF